MPHGGNSEFSSYVTILLKSLIDIDTIRCSLINTSCTPNVDKEIVSVIKCGMDN